VQGGQGRERRDDQAVDVKKVRVVAWEKELWGLSEGNRKGKETAAGPKAQTPRRGKKNREEFGATLSQTNGEADGGPVGREKGQTARSSKGPTSLKRLRQRGEADYTGDEKKVSLLIGKREVPQTGVGRTTYWSPPPKAEEKSRKRKTKGSAEGGL